MFRLIGIMTGAALAVAFLILALGLPDLSAPETDATAEPVVEPAEQPATLTDAEVENVAEPAPRPETEPAAETVAETLPETAAEPVPETDYESLVEQIFAPEPETSTGAQENWYSFWSPFRSELAANGFVSKLQETTGIDYRVVKIKTGVYEVAFAYSDDEDIQEKLTRISAATGLDMSDS